MKRFNLFLLVFAAIGLVSCEKDSDVISGNYYAEFKLCEDNDMVASSQATNLNELAKLMNAELANTKFDESQLNVYLEKAYGIVVSSLLRMVQAPLMEVSRYLCQTDRFARQATSHVI